jgi:hypothetical protein
MTELFDDFPLEDVIRQVKGMNVKSAQMLLEDRGARDIIVIRPEDDFYCYPANFDIYRVFITVNSNDIVMSASNG